MRRKKKTQPLTKKIQNHAAIQEEEFKNSPHTFVFHKGKVGKNIADLITDFRKVMEPYTASRLKRTKKNSMKDFINVAGMLHVTHFVMVSKTEASVHNFTLARDVKSSLKRQNALPQLFLHQPLLVMNNLSCGDGMQLKLTSTMLQNMFPSINVNKINLNNIRRCVLFNYDPESKTMEFRHYGIRAVPVGISKGVKKLVKAKVPDMGKYDDISEFLHKSGELSESEAEQDGPFNEVILPQELSSRGNLRSSKSAIRLTELGPRMTLQLVKIEDGICGGKVLFHEYVHKTEEEIESTTKAREHKRIQKENRKEQQRKNVAKKNADKKPKVESSNVNEDDSEDNLADDEDDDAQYFRDEVGEEPEEELFSKKKFKNRKRKEGTNVSTSNSKKPRVESKSGPKQKVERKTGPKVERKSGPKREKSNDRKAKHSDKRRDKEPKTVQQVMLERKRKKMKQKSKQLQRGVKRKNR